MHSALPKVLHCLAGRPLLVHVYHAAAALAPRAIHVVHGHGGELVRAHCAHLDVEWVVQHSPRGTGDAVQCALPGIPADDRVLVLCGDVPLLQPAGLQRLVAAADGGALALLTTRLQEPGGYGRILRSADGNVGGIIEERDAGPEQRALQEVFTGALCAPAAVLHEHLQAGNAAPGRDGEHYLTALVQRAAQAGANVAAVAIQPWQAGGINTRAQLAEMEQRYRRHAAETLLAAGVTLVDPQRLDVRGEVEAAADVVIDVGVILEGRVVLARGVRIGAYSIVRDSRLGADAEVLPYSHVEGAEVGARCRLGPYCRIRPGTQLETGARIGNFVELKQARVGSGAKINHLSYVGDAEVGTDTNLGCGTVTCNYDGSTKHRTVIGNDVFIGSSCQLVAPVTVGDGATVAAGSTITEDVAAGTLAVARSRQQSVAHWQRPGRRR